MRRGELQPALAETERAIRCFRSEDSEWHWRFTIQKAELLWRLGSNNQTIALLAAEPPASLASTDLAIRRKLALATANAQTQHLADADRLLDEAEALAKAQHPELLGEISLRRGTVGYYQDNWEKSEAAYQQALQNARQWKEPFQEAAALEGLGIVATKTEHYDAAIDWSRSSAKLAQSLGAPRMYAEAVGNMAWCYRELGDFENALTLYNQAEDFSKRVGAVNGQIFWLTGIESVYYQQHDYSAAQAVLTQTLELARRQDNKRTLTEYLNDLSEAALETGQIDLAEKSLNEAVELEKVNPDQEEALASLLLRGRIRESNRDYAAAEDCFRKLVTDPKASSAQKWEGQARLAKLYSEEGLDAKAESEFRHSLDTNEAVRSSVQNEELRMPFLSTALSFYDDYIAFLIAHGRVQDALQVAELARAKTLAEGLGAQSKSISFSSRGFQPRQIAERAHATLLFYWLGQTQSYLWLITPAKVSYFPLPKQSEVDSLVKAYRQSVVDGRDVLASGNESGKRLYEMLVAPARDSIPKNSRVILLPADSLYTLNFETLVVPDPAPHFWIEDVTLSEANSLTLLSAATQTTASAQNNMLLVGNPESSDSAFPQLAQAPVEIQKVSAHFPGSQCTLLQGKQATPSAYLESKPEHFAYLHFVAHSNASQIRPLESAVILSREGDSYKLYAREILAHPLKARLVTISACNGAGTRSYAGEGLVGLSWAFLRAGAHNVVAALWEVSDASSTAQLMDAFYSELDSGHDPASALRNAKLLILKSNGSTVFRKPFYWAPFQLYVGS
jgi:CHAT domain-containing protein